MCVCVCMVDRDPNILKYISFRYCYMFCVLRKTDLQRSVLLIHPTPPAAFTLIHAGMKTAAYRPATYRKNTLRKNSSSAGGPSEELTRSLQRRLNKDAYTAVRPWLK